MKEIQLFVLPDYDGYAVELPVTLHQLTACPDLRKVVRTFEYIAEEFCALESYHRNPFACSEQTERQRLLDRYYDFRPDGTLVALFRVRHSQEMHRRMTHLVQIANLSFDKGLFL